MTGPILQFFNLLGLHFVAFWPCGPSFPCILALWAFISLHFGLVGISLHFGLMGLHFLAFWLCGLHFLAFWPCGPSFPCILALWAFISLHFGLFGVSFRAPPHKLPKMARLPNVLTMVPFLTFWAVISFHFGLRGFHFLSFWPFGLSFPFILAFWAFISFHFALGLARGVSPPQVATAPFILCYFGLLGCHFLSFCPFWLCFPFICFFWVLLSLQFGLFFDGSPDLWTWRRFWRHIRDGQPRPTHVERCCRGLCGPSFPCILALWAFISLHFGLVGLHFLAFWPFRGQLLAPPPQVAKNGPFAQRPYNGFIRAVTGSILQFLAFWAFISLHFGLVGRHFLAFWPCGSSFPCVLAFWAFISFHFGLVGLHFLASWHFRGQLLGYPPQVAKNGPFAQRPYNNGFSSAVTGPILQFFNLLGLHFVAFWPCGPSFPCILALWAFISLHFGLVGISLHFGLMGLHFLAFWLCDLHFLAFWPCGPSFPCILALWAFISLHFGLFGVSFRGPPHKLPKMARLPNVLTMVPFLAFWAVISFHFGLRGFHFLSFWPFGLSFPFILAFWAFISFHFALGLARGVPPPQVATAPFILCYFGLLGCHFLSFCPFWLCFPFICFFWFCFPCSLAFSSTALPTFGRGDVSGATSGTVRPVQHMLNDAAGVSHAPAPVLHREGLSVGPLPTEEDLLAATWQATKVSQC